MGYYIKYPAHSVFEHGVFAPYATLEEAERQAANDLRENPHAVESIIQTDGELVVPDYEPGGYQGDWKAKDAYGIVHTRAKLLKLTPKHLADLLREAQEAQVQTLLDIHEAIKQGKGLENAIPGNAYTVVSGGTATGGAIALAAATAKTVIGIAAGATSQPSLTELGLSFDGVTASAVPVLVESVSGTNATNAPGTNSTTMTPKQLRGWPASASVSTAAYNWTTEPTVLEVFKKRLLTPNGGLIILQFPMGREPTGLITAATQFKFFGIRLTAPAIVNCHVDLEFEE